MSEIDLKSIQPPCPFCGSTSFRSGGGSFSPLLVQQSQVCDGCDAFVEEKFHAGGRLLIYFQRSSCTQNPEYPDMYKLPEAWVSWFNTILMPAWRDRESRLKAHEDAEWRKWLAEVFYPAFPGLKGSIPAPRPPSYKGEEPLVWEESPFTDESISYHDLTPEQRALYEGQFYEGGDATKGRKQVGSYLPVPPDLRVPVYPPQLPVIPGVVSYFWGTVDWNPIDHQHSLSLPLIEDPILARNREFFDDVWAQVGKQLGETLPAAVPVKNEYGGIEPWYSLNYRGATVTLGWRKRVVSLRVETARSISVKLLKALATRDGVTFEATRGKVRKPIEEVFSNTDLKSLRQCFPDGMIEVDEPGDTGSGATQVTIHAWGKDKTVEYLSAMCRSLRAVVA